MRRWTLPELIEEKVFGILTKLEWSDHELEPVRTIEYECDPENNDPSAWLKTDNFRQGFKYVHLRTVMQVFRDIPLYLSPKSSRAKAHLLVVRTSYKTYGALSGIRTKEARS